MRPGVMTLISLILIHWFLIVPSEVGASEAFPLGILGGRGQVEPNSSLISVLSIDPGSPAALAGLKVGDQLRGIGGIPFTQHSGKIDVGGLGPQKSLGEALDECAARELEKDRKITLDLLRDETELALELILPPRPGLKEAAGRALLIESCCRQLVSTQRPDGRWDSPVGLTGDRVLSAWAVVALLSADHDQYRDSIERGIRWLRGPQDHCWIADDPLKKGPDNLGNWAITSTVVALTEHWIATQDHLDPPVIERCCKSLAARMTDDGLFGHDVVPGYSNKGFNVINTLSHLAWSMGAQAGVTLDEDSWSKSLDQIRRSIDPNGGIRYWTMKGTGTGDASLRTSSMALALSISAREPQLTQQFGDYLAAHPSRMREAHAVGSLGMMLAPSALWRINRAGYSNFLEEWRWYLSLMHRPDRSVHYIGGKGNNGGDSYLGKHRIGCIIAILILTPPDEKLRLHIDKPFKKPELKVDGVSEATSSTN
ncbi:MAG: DUF6288 domain-containing protein [Planctomycetota bacterium]|nr:DUF6288 domain-containing protein [Planctomycetota bacterium]